MKPKIQHTLNPLHVYCRLRDLKLPKKPSLIICKFYEKGLYSHISKSDHSSFTTVTR